MTSLLQCVEVETGGAVRSAVIWLHGLGADGHDFEPIVPYLGMENLGVRFVFPHAERRAVTINTGLIMPAWYDIRSLHLGVDIDERGIRDSAEQVARLVARERERGVAAARIVLAGFSQGGVIAVHVALRHKETLAGIMALSTYLPLIATVEDEIDPANGATPVLQAHGAGDPMIPLELGEAARDRLQALGHPLVWRCYPMQHEVSPDEIADIGVWLRSRLADA
jgi:phospholipase/carboxylesterase